MFSLPRRTDSYLFPVRLFLVIATVFWNSWLHADDWPQWLGPQRDSIWRETGICESFPAGGPPVRWRVPVGAGYSSPIVANGRVYVTDRIPSETPTATSGLNRAKVPGLERVLCLDEANGKQIWHYDYDCPYDLGYPFGPRASPIFSEGRVYTLGAEGNLFCFEAETGKVLWSHDFQVDFGAATQNWGVASHPLIDGKKLICMVGGEGHTIMAFDKETGTEIWRAGTAKDPAYSAPVIYEAGGVRQLIAWDTESLTSYDPETGKVYWTEPFKTKMGQAIVMPRKMGNLLFISSFMDGSMMMRLDDAQPAASVLWKIRGKSERNTAGLHSLMSPPFLEDGYIYGICSYGQLRCLKAETGERLWESLAPTTPDLQPMRWASAFIVKNGNRFFIYNEKGDLIIAKLSPAGYEEISRAHLLEPTNTASGRPVHWSHPAYANGCFFGRNDQELICVSLRGN